MSTSTSAAPGTRSLARHWPNLVLFLVLAAVLMAVQWQVEARNVLHEMGDFAANSLLILDAKRLHLLYGNYSRIGVHHPGPAIMYVLAAGEALFHDLLHVAPSPFSGQLLAVGVYSAAWITLIFSMLRRMTGEIVPALLFTLVFTAVLGLVNPRAFLGPWFPDLYTLPFAAVLVAISRLAYGQTDMLRPLAVASGFTINGHVSFIPMLGVILIVMLAANLLLSLKAAERRVVAPAFLQRHRRPLLESIGILFLFFVPLLILTVTEWPGPLYDYVKFGGIDKHNSLREALKFAGMYWRTPVKTWVWAVALLVLLAAGARTLAAAQLRAMRGLGIACVGASVALVVYAKFGIDHLDLIYIGLFYYTVPALTVALVVLFVYQAVPWTGKTSVAAILAAGGLLATVDAARKPAIYRDNWYRPGGQALYEQLRKVPGTGRIVLDVENNGIGWEYVWGDVAAIQLYALRQGQDLVCINESWHILFTKAGRCRPDELNNPQRRFFVRPQRMAAMVSTEPDIEGQSLLLYRHGRALERVGYTTLEANKELFRSLLGKGWAQIETDFVWSDGPVAELNLPADPQRGKAVYLDLNAFMPELDFRQHVDAYLNGALAGSADFDHWSSRRQIKLALLDPAAAQHIELRIAHPVAPKDYGNSVDTRLLGVGLYGMR